MSYLVVWSNVAFDQMGLILRAMPLRRAEFAGTLKAIASKLRTDPMEQGESRDDADRIWFVGDLIIVFSVDVESSTVEIASIRHNSRGSS